MKKLGLLIFAILLSGSPRGFASGVKLTIDLAVTEGLTNSPAVAKMEAVTKEKSWGRVEAFSRILPTVDLSAQHYFDAKYQLNTVNLGGGPTDFPVVFPSTSVDLKITTPIFDGFRSFQAIAAGQRFSRAAELELEWTKFQTAHEIRLKFYQAIAAKNMAEVSAQNLKTIREHLDQVKLRQRAGASTNFDVLKIEVKLSEAESEVLEANDNVFLARQRLALTMGLEGDERQLSGNLPEPKEIALGDRKSSRSDLKAFSQRAAAASNVAAAAKLFWLPKVYLGGMISKYNNVTERIGDFDRYRTSYAVGIFLNWGLFSGLSSVAKMNEAIAQQEQAESSLLQETLKQPYEVEFWRRRYSYSAALWRARSSDVSKAEESVRIAKIALRAGTLTNTEVLDAELDLFRARAGVVSALMNNAEAKLNLDSAMGRNL